MVQQFIIIESICLSIFYLPNIEAESDEPRLSTRIEDEKSVVNLLVVVVWNK